jgi:predicted nucleic acid-binding Zn ribbon protein
MVRAIQKAGTTETLGHRLAILVPAKKGEDTAGAIYPYRLMPFGVVCVRTETLGAEVKRATKPRAWNQIVGLLQLLDAHNKGDMLLARSGIIKTCGFDEGGFDALLRPTSPRNPWKKQMDDMCEPTKIGILAAEEITKQLKTARLVLWHPWRAGAHWLEPAVFCPNMETALFVAGALQYVRICPSCGVPFLPARPDQEYCSIRCRETFRKRRLRARKTTKQGGKGNGGLQAR